ncbi:MAG: AbrB/MazE/SpoVT family DNA-binding domain-containing protein [Sulfuricella sp.]
MAATSNLSHGRTVIPAALREQLGIKDGDQLIWEIRDSELVVTTRVAQLRRAQALIHRYVPENVSLSDELITDRRVEQTAEDAR